jgi:hypothetical protein
MAATATLIPQMLVLMSKNERSGIDFNSDSELVMGNAWEGFEFQVEHF